MGAVKVHGVRPRGPAWLQVLVLGLGLAGLSLGQDATSERLRAFQAGLGASLELEEQAARTNPDPAKRAAHERSAVVLRNLRRLAELSEEDGTVEQLLASEQVLLEFARPPEEGAPADLKRILRRVPRASRRALGRALGAASDLLSPTRIDRDPDEVFRRPQSDDELASAAYVLLSIPRTEGNAAAMDRSLRLLLDALGCKPKTPRPRR